MPVVDLTAGKAKTTGVPARFRRPLTKGTVMAHELDHTSGVYSFADSRTDAWHRLGTSVGHAMTAREALQASHLANWNVRKMGLVIPQEPVITPDGVTTPPPVPVTDMFATVRDNPVVAGQVDYLGVVGTKYEPVQNEASCAVLDALTDESGAHFETAGALKGGRETFVTMKLPKSMTFDGRDGSQDRTDWYIAALNSHDASSKFRLLLTSVRIVCANTQAAAIAGAKSTFGIRHTAGARTAIHEARTALGLAWRYMDAFENEAAALYARTMDIDEMRHFAARLVKADDMSASTTARRNRQQQAASIVKLWTSSATIAPIAGTRWAAYNAVTEYLDHVAPVRGAGTARAAADTRALRAVTPGSSVETLKVDAFRLLQTL
jgi:phage/plasmid-like protein (TIGR03299 family)